MHDDRHLTLLINTDRRRLVRAATRLLGMADAEDAVQDAYVRALEARVTTTPRPDAAQAWLLTVMRNLAIDRLRRRQWMAHWLAGTQPEDTAPIAAPSAEMEVALAQEAARALRLLATHLTPADGAALLLHVVFEAGHTEIAQASGRSAAGSRQQLRRALLRLRQAGRASAHPPYPEHDAGDETVFRLYLQSLQLRDPRALWAMLRDPPVHASAKVFSSATRGAASPDRMGCGIVHAGGQLGLVVTLDGVRLCVVPLGVQAERASESALL
ncbi:RNA polymerase sigma factor [Comamonadaceae bacterium G21597-S1]|nr:RNA polymerase sigma factor [Comamonadaceae bacterium G21597-S1]